MHQHMNEESHQHVVSQYFGRFTDACPTSACGIYIQTTQPEEYLVVENKWHVAFLLAGNETIEQHREAADEGLSNCARPRLADDHVTGCHPFRHVVHKAFDGDLQQH